MPKRFIHHKLLKGTSLQPVKNTNKQSSQVDGTFVIIDKKGQELFDEAVFNSPEIREIIYKHFKENHCEVSKIINICTEENRIKFNKALKRIPGGKIVLCYHGTRNKNIQKIISKGFMIPSEKSGINVENGSVLGLGVYSAATPTISLRYTNSNRMLICVCVISDNQKITKLCGHIAVSFRDDQIIPVLMVSYKTADEGRFINKGFRHSEKIKTKRQPNKFNVQYRQEMRQIQKENLEHYFEKLLNRSIDGLQYSEAEEEEDNDETVDTFTNISNRESTNSQENEELELNNIIILEYQ